MSDKVTQDLRMQLAVHGFEVAPDDLDSILQAAAHIANLVGGCVYFETPAGWGAEIGLALDDPEQAWVDVYLLEDEDEEEAN